MIAFGNVVARDDSLPAVTLSLPPAIRNHLCDFKNIAGREGKLGRRESSVGVESPHND